jgi:uncharacterized protein YjbJ (UPF0337 family)
MSSLRNYLKGRWQEIGGIGQRWWGNLTDDEKRQWIGRYQQAAGLLQAKYGLASLDNDKTQLLETLDAVVEPATPHRDQKRWLALLAAVLVGLVIDFWAGGHKEAMA